MKRLIRLVFTLLISLLYFPALVHAQGNPNCDPGDPSCPIDSGLIVLLAIGVGYGIKKYYDLKRSSSQLDNKVSE
ncbi:MAG TPA: hypothetical protein VIJ92_16550 [Ginsengibacter sp.]